MTAVDAQTVRGRAVDQSLGYLLGRMALVELEIREAVLGRLAHDPEPGDQLRGVYLSDAYVQWLLDRPAAEAADPPPPSTPQIAAQVAQLERDADAAESTGVTLRLRQLSRAFELDAIDEHLLVIALAPALDPRFQQLIGYLNDDVTRRSPTVALATELASGVHPSPPQHWCRLAPTAPLVAQRLIEVKDPDRPLPAKSLSVPDRVVNFLLGDDAVDPVLQPLLRAIDPLPVVDPVLAPLETGTWVYLCQRPGTDAATEAATWLARHHSDVLVATLPTAASTDDLLDTLGRLACESRLSARPLVVGPCDGLAADEATLSGLGRVMEGVANVVLWTTAHLDLRWATHAPVMVDLEVPEPAHRLRAWLALCQGLDVSTGDLRRLADRHRLGAAMVARAVAAANARAVASGRPVDLEALHVGLRSLDGAALQRLTRRIHARRTWPDLILPEKTIVELRDFVAMVRMRDHIADWGLARGGVSRGIAALFVGPSGTGKTLAAEVVASELGVNLYAVDLSTVVDKYVGETEKNLDRVLSAAEEVTGVLFFDEADALFGKRADVQRGQDRYANLEVSYLLQRVEDFGGVVILATNLRAHVDDAFLRRIDTLIEFGPPDTDQRLALWRAHTSRLPRGDDLDLEFVAGRFEFSGGSIRNCVATAACLAAESAEPVGMRHLVRGLEREQEKLGRLRVAGDFGPYMHFMHGRS